MLYLPMFLRGLGMMTLIIAFALFTVEDLPPKYLLSNAFFLITFRSVLTPVIASAFYSNTLYRLQQKYMVELSETLSATDPLAAARWQSTLNSSLGKGMALMRQPSWPPIRSTQSCSSKAHCWH